MSHFADFLLPVIMFGPMFVVSLFVPRALQSGSYQRQAAAPMMLFQVPVSVIVFALTLALSIVIWSVPIYDPAMLNTLIHFESQQPTTQIDVIKKILAFGTIAAASYWGVIHWHRRTCYLALDKERRTYRTIDMTSVTLKAQTGSWDEIAGISVQKTSAKGTVTYYVRLKWKRQVKLLASSLGGFSKRDKAEAFATRMSEELGLPLVAAPMR